MAGRLLQWFHRMGSCQLRALRMPVAGQVRGLATFPSSCALCPQRLSSAHVLSPVCQDWSFPRSLHVSAARFKKGKDKGGKKGKGKHVKLSDEELCEVFDVDRLHMEMQAVVERLRHLYLTQLGPRITAGVLKEMVVHPMSKRLDDLGQISQNAPDRIQVSLSRAEYLDDIKKTIQKLYPVITVQQEGNHLFLTVPTKMTQEHRNKLIEAVSAKFNEAKSSLQKIYQKYHKNINSVKSEHSEDLVWNCQETVKDVLHSYQDKMEELMKIKKSELQQAK